ncbi:hypothetical protein [Pimelobacter simplex]|uniref:hypothetical protein n=1 Tax=Nocardioides simplex TaxID=2045 RepID=UPI00214F8F16|nr:hypothetical protein [Pimelobacter simplex]UUW92477.1 hypothetical protein M0M43_13615 [Pimelobacter simplex]UUW96305.1 hypothetical protein M0M48_02250 [Pimelobacter simplex]
MTNMHSRLEARLARLLLAPPPLAVPATTPIAKLDLVYLSGEDQNRLDRLLD